MASRFIKLISSSESEWLLLNQPKAFLLLTHIAIRARREQGLADGLKIGEALIGDYKNYGLKTRGEYRHALKILLGRAHIVLIENCRNRKKATTGTTTVGTKVKIISSTVYDINFKHNNHPNNHRTTTEQPPNNHEQDSIDSKKEKKYVPCVREKFIHFNPDKGIFENLSDEQIELWQKEFMDINIRAELNRMREWLSNPKNPPRKGSEAFILKWLSQAKKNPSKKFENNPGFETNPYLEAALHRQKLEKETA